MKYLKKFDTHTEYEEARQNLILPNVSLCTQENEVYYNPLPSTPMIDGHAYVDLGLPSGTKWATMNVGATSETDYGNYYQYGKGAAQYAATSGDSNYSGTESPLAATADTAVQEWGGSWHMPTEAQFQELIDNTNNEWTTVNNVNGYKFTNKADNTKYIFIPAAGYYGSGSLSDVGHNGNVWSSTPDDRANGDAYYLFFNDSYKFVDNDAPSGGNSVRPVVG